MRRTFFGLLLVVSFCVPAAWPRDKEVPPPLFIAPEFRFSQVDTICVAPAIDLRADKTEPLNLSGPGERHGLILPDHIESVDTRLARDFKKIGYQTVSCSPVNATLGDLKIPTDTWLGKLDFGESRWLFILAVEDVSAEYKRFWPQQGSVGGYAVVSGYLFQRQATGVRLVWRDRVVGRSRGELMGRKRTVKLAESDFAIGEGAICLLRKFEMRPQNKRIPSMWCVWDENKTETFDATCNVVWTALNDILKNSGKYDVIGIADSDMMAIYAIGGAGDRAEHSIDHVVLKSKENSCVMRITETAHITLRNDVGNLNKLVRASLSK